MIRTPEYYQADVLGYRAGRPREQELYEALFQRLETLVPQASVKVQKSQISFYNRHLFAAASIPLRRRKDWPEHCLLVTFGLAHRVEDPAVAVATEPYPTRWTHHVVVDRREQLDEKLLGWLLAAYQFSQEK